MDREPAAAKPNSPRAWLMVAAAFIKAVCRFRRDLQLWRLSQTDGDRIPHQCNRRLRIIYHALHRGGILFPRRIDRSSHGPLRAANYRRGRRVDPRIRTGLCLTALADHIWFCYLAYGVAACCTCRPWRSSADGSFGIATRRLVSPPPAPGAARWCSHRSPPHFIQRYGWRGTNIIFGLAAGIVLLGCAIAVKSPPVARSTSGAEVGCRNTFRSREFVLLSSRRMQSAPHLLPFSIFCLPSPAIIGASEVAAAALVSVIGGASIIGRLVFGPDR